MITTDFNATNEGRGLRPGQLKDSETWIERSQYPTHPGVIVTIGTSRMTALGNRVISTDECGYGNSFDSLKNDADSDICEYSRHVL
ncbi:hypothetical protein Pan258_03290 [Symmachiella dynata]|nr:hypothetical protein Pan258_03290 [Symmachiella dynata]